MTTLPRFGSLSGYRISPYLPAIIAVQLMIKKIFFSLYSWSVFLVLFLTHFIVASSVMWLFPKPYAAHMAITRPFIKLIYRMHGVRLSISGLENLPKSGSFILMANHLSLLDILTILAAVPVDFAFVGKEELARVPILGWDMILAKHFFIRRTGGKLLRTQMNKIQSTLEGGRPLFVFPEGSRSHTGEMSAFKNGFFNMAIAAAVPIVPCAITGTDHILKRNSLMIHHGDIKISVGAPVLPLASSEDALEPLKEQVRRQIQEMVDHQSSAI